MELRRMTIWLAFFAVAVVVQCSEAHTTQKRGIEDDYADPDIQNDEGSDDEAQNDAEGGDDEEPEVNADIVTIPSYYNVTVGKTVRLECKTVPSNDNTVVQWSKNNTMYFIGTQKPHPQVLRQYIQDPRFTIAENSTDLLVRDVRPQDSGVYKCELLQTTPRSIEHNVVVLESPRIIKFTASNNGRVVEGGDVLLTCEVAGSPPPQVVWSREVDNGNKRLEERDGEFTLNSVYIKNVQREQAGKYYCYAFNSAGSNQQEYNIVVLGKPRVHVSRAVINSAVGVTAVLQCSAHDDQAPHIRWYKDGMLLEDTASQYDMHTEGHHSNLTLTPQTDRDFGTYTCEAENSMGSHNRSIDLVQRPVIEELDSDGPKLTWTVHSHQPLEVIELQLRNLDGESEWRSIQVPIPETRTHQYEIVYVLDDKSLEPGKYEATVQVKNSKTWSEHSERATVEIEAQPQYIQHASVYRGSGYSIRPTATILSSALMYLLVRMF